MSGKLGETVAANALLSSPPGHVALYHGKAIAKAPLDAFAVVVLIRSSRDYYH